MPKHHSMRWRSWQFAVAVAVGTVGLCYAVSFLVPELFGRHNWIVPPDGRWTINSAQWVANGAVGTVYQANPQYLPLPGFLFLLAPVVAFGGHLGLVNYYPIILPRPSMWLVVAPAFFVTGASCILGADYLADTLDISPARRRVIATGIGLWIVVPTCVWSGHPEDLAALGLTCLALALTLRSRPAGAAFALAGAIMMQPWAGLLVPLLVATSPVGMRMRTLVRSSALPGATALLLLALDWANASRSLLVQPMQGDGQHLPWWNLFVHHLTIIQGGAPLAVRSGSEIRLLAIALAVAAAVFVRGRRDAQSIVGAASLIMLARGVFETQVWSWYLAPAAVLLALHAATRPGWSGHRWAVAAVGAWAVYALPTGAYIPFPWHFTMPSWLALAGFAVAGLAAFGRPGRVAERSRPGDGPGIVGLPVEPALV